MSFAEEVRASHQMPPQSFLSSEARFIPKVTRQTTNGPFAHFPYLTKHRFYKINPRMRRKRQSFTSRKGLQLMRARTDVTELNEVIASWNEVK